MPNRSQEATEKDVASSETTSSKKKKKKKKAKHKKKAQQAQAASASVATTSAASSTSESESEGENENQHAQEEEEEEGEDQEQVCIRVFAELVWYLGAKQLVCFEAVTRTSPSSINASLVFVCSSSPRPPYPTLRYTTLPFPDA